MITILFSFAVCLTSFAADRPSAQLPESLLKVGTAGSSYVLVVDKSSSRLDVYRKLDDQSVVLVQSYRATTGALDGDKQREGDLRTPEGVYYFVRIREDRELLPKYGIRAFDLNYPNQFDLLDGKNGYGIWLHATDEPERLLEPRSSQGCVVVSNEAIREISRYITLYRTPIIISERLSYRTLSELKPEKDRILRFVRGWLDAWSTQNFERYRAAYSDHFRNSSWKLRSWLNSKRAVFRATSWARVDVADMKVLSSGDRYAVTFFQRYRSNLMDDTGVKWIYLRDENGGLRIVGEDWFPLGKAKAGHHWNRNQLLLSEVIDDLREVSLERGSKLAITAPEYSAPAHGSAEPAVVSGGEGSSTEAPVAAEEFIFAADGNERIRFSMKLRKVDQDGSRLRGRMFIVAGWEDPSAYSSFPAATLRSGKPVELAEGDRFGIRWFKVVQGSINRPAAGARLREVRCLVFSRDGNLLLEKAIPINEN